jgi:hypothetical protein
MSTEGRSCFTESHKIALSDVTNLFLKSPNQAGHRCLTPVILALRRQRSGGSQFKPAQANSL